MTMTRAALLVALGACAGGLASAHHSVSGRFDPEKRVRLSGVISKVEWVNPHAFLHLDVAGEDGEVVTWRLETLPTAMLSKAGVTPELLGGDAGIVTVEAILARDGEARLAWLLRLDHPAGGSYHLAEPR